MPRSTKENTTSGRITNPGAGEQAPAQDHQAGGRPALPGVALTALAQGAILEGAARLQVGEIVMTLSTVPDYFQEESEDALREQVQWLVREVGVEDSFFARLLRVDEETLAGW